MNQISYLDKNKTYYFMGIGGINMSALAKLLISEGYRISGSDIQRTELTEFFELQGYKINYKQEKGNLNRDYVIIKTDAISKDNEEYKEALEMDLEIIPRAMLLNYLSKKNKKISLAVTGTHGKTTTTTMLSHIFCECGLDPTCVIGGIVPYWNSNLRIGDGDYFIYEACEAFNNFKYYEPNYLIVTSIDADHFDCLIDLENEKRYFIEFINRVGEKGFVLLNYDDENIKSISVKLKGNIKYYSINETIENSSVIARATKIQYDKTITEFDFIPDDKESFRIKANLLGLHNVQNALSALILSSFFIKEKECLSKSLINFRNSKRRFEYLGEYRGAQVYNDYAHHPKEILALSNSVNTLLKESKKSLIIFQPHLYSRTKELYKSFAESLSHFDIVILFPIYPAREKAIEGVSSNLIYDELLKTMSKNNVFLSDFDSCQELVDKYSNTYDIILTVGAGSIGSYYSKFLSL